MAQNPLKQSTGDAQIVQTGHTAQQNHASNPDMKVKGNSSVRDLNVGANGN